MATSKIWMALSALVGAGVALITTLSVRDAEDSDPQVARAPADGASNSTRANKSVMLQVSPGRLNALEQEVARLRDGRTEHGAPSPTELPDPVEERRRVEARFAELERRLLAEPVDRSWSGGATEALRNELSAIARKDGFDLVSVECRTETCRAILRWDNYEAAVKTGMRLPERAIPGLNCLKSIWLKEPANSAETYSSNLFLECSEQRAGIADAVR